MAKKSKKPVVRVSHFIRGEKVVLFRGVAPASPRAFDPALGEKVATATVSEDGIAEFSDPGEGRFTAATEREGVGWVAVQTQAASVPEDPPDKGASSVAEPTPVSGPKTRVIGARGTKAPEPGQVDSTFADQRVGNPADVPAGEVEPSPAPRIEDVQKGTKLVAQSTTGEAIPAAPDELSPPRDTPNAQPPAKQEDVAARTLQRSDTPHGTEAPIEGSRAEDLAKASAPRTRTGQGASPGGGTRDVVREGEDVEVEPDAAEKRAAADETPSPGEARPDADDFAKPRTSARKAPAPRKRSSSKKAGAKKSGSKKSSGQTKAARSRAAKKAAATRKRNAAKKSS